MASNSYVKQTPKVTYEDFVYSMTGRPQYFAFFLKKACGIAKNIGVKSYDHEELDVRAENIYINQPLKQISPESYKKIADVKYGERDYYRAEIIAKKPVLSTDVPATPGFIGLTRVDNDEYEYINPCYIIKMKPVSFEKYDGKETGTRILYAAHGSERAITVDYYEKLAWLQESTSFGGHSIPKGGHRKVSGNVRAKVREEVRKEIEESTIY